MKYPTPQATEWRHNKAHGFQGGTSGESVLSPEGTAESLPQIPFVEFELMFFKQGDEHFVETHFAVMRFLVLDVLSAENTVTI